MVVGRLGSAMHSGLQSLPHVPEAVGSHWRFMNRETACERFYLGSRLDLKHF